MRLEGKKAIVTGAGRGIGRGCALQIAKNGADLVVNDRPDSPDLMAIAQEAIALGRSCTAIEADVFDRTSCETLVGQAMSALGRIDILISNPACSIEGDFLDYDPNDFERVITGTLTSGFHMGQLVARQMIQRGDGGKIVFISSVHARVPYGGAVAYNAAKAGVISLTRTLAVELAAYGVRVNAVSPGPVYTDFNKSNMLQRSLSLGISEEEMIERVRAAVPLGKWGEPTDIAAAVAFLCSPDASWITGEILRVSGGMEGVSAAPPKRS